MGLAEILSDKGIREVTIPLNDAIILASLAYATLRLPNSGLSYRDAQMIEQTYDRIAAKVAQEQGEYNDRN